MTKKIKARDFQKYLAQQLKNPEFKKHYDEVNIKSKIIKKRKNNPC